jgi:hypothetical protein
VQRLAARDQDGQLRTRADRLGDTRSCVEQVLEVVEHEQQPLVSDRRRQRVRRAERLGGRGLDEARVREGGERHPPDTVVVVVCRGRGRLQREPGLAAPAGPGQRNEANVGASKQRRDLVDLALATQERRRRNRQVRLVQRLQRREGVRPELEEALRRAQVLQPMQAEVAHFDAREVGGGLREQHLATVPRGRDPCRTVHVEPDVPLVGAERLARVEAHPHPHRAALERRLRIGRGLHCIGCTRKGDEERVTLRVDLDAVVQPERLPQRTPVLGQDARVAVAQLLEQPRRPFDVGEEKSHRPGRKLGLHPSILSRAAALL